MVKSIIMASTIVFDMADPGVKAVVDGWADNTEYEVTMKVKTGAGAQRNVSEVVSMEAGESGSPEKEEPEEEPAPDSGMMGKMPTEDRPKTGKESKKPSMPAIPYK